MSILSEILASKKREVYCARKSVTTSELEKCIRDMPPTRDFIGAIESAPGTAFIAEVKKASPSKGVIRIDFDPETIARVYHANGATCLSVLTDEPYFQGHLDHLRIVRKVTDRPVLRKDFLVDDYQLLEAREAGADAVLMIAAALTATEMEWMLEAAHALGLAAIVEVHNEEEVREVLKTPARLIGINNRDLHLFRTTIRTTLDLMPLIPPDRIVISESGVNARSDVEALAAAGVRAVLVGEALMREDDIGAKLRQLMGTA